MDEAHLAPKLADYLVCLSGAGGAGVGCFVKDLEFLARIAQAKGKLISARCDPIEGGGLLFHLDRFGHA